MKPKARETLRGSFPEPVAERRDYAEQAGSLSYVVLTLRGSFPEPVAERRDYAEQAGSLSYVVLTLRGSFPEPVAERRDYAEQIHPLYALALCLILALPAIAEDIATPPESFSFPPSPTRIHIAKGLWWRLYRIHEAGALMGGAIYEESFDVFGDSHGYCGYGKTLGDFPERNEQFFRYHAIVITGCRAGAIQANTQKRLREWVNQGGGLLVIGGIQGLGRGKYHGTVLEELIPATVSKDDDLKKTSPGAVLSPTPEGTEFFGASIPWRQKPRLYYAHGGLNLKDGAKILLESQGQPILMTWKVGKGRVALFAGTVCGEPAVGELAYWEWDGWPMVLSRTLKWLVKTPAAKSPDKPVPSTGRDYQTKLQQLKELINIDVEGLFDDEQEEPDPKTAEDSADVLDTIMKLAHHCRDGAYALAVVKALAESGTTIKFEYSELIFNLIGSYIAGKEFGDPGIALATSSNSGRAALGIRVLARAALSEGRPHALRYLSKGIDGLSGAAREASLAPAMRVETGEDERLRLAAVRALADYADEDLRPLFRKSAAGWKEKKTPTPAIAELQKDLAEEIQLALCLMGDGAAAVNVVNIMVRNRLKIDENLDITQRPLYVPIPSLISQREQAAAEIPHLRARNDRLASTLARFPQSGLPVLAAKASTWKGDLVSVYLQACLADRRSGEALSGPEQKALARIFRECELESVRSLCLLRLQQSPQEAARLLSDLSRGKEEDILFALSRCSTMPDSVRVAVVRSGLEHSSRKVRHKAARTIVLLPTDKQGRLWKMAMKLAEQDDGMKAIVSQLGP